MKIFVGNLPFNTTETSLRELFAAHGAVDKVDVIMDRETGQPRGFGFVEMPNPDAGRAMQALHGTEHEGRTLKVNEAKDRERPSKPGRRY